MPKVINDQNSLVTTVSGVTELIGNCRKYQGQYYLMGVDCILHGDRWYYGRDKICYDHETGQAVLKNSKLLQGVVDFDEDTIPVIGYYSPNPYYNVTVTTKHGTYLCKDYRLLEPIGYVEDTTTGEWFHPRSINISQLNSIIRGDTQLSYKNKGYNIEDNVDEMQLKRTLYDNFKSPIPKVIKRYAKLIGDITWGAEIEFSKGGLPEHIQNQLGIVICRDGSTASGGEAVTIPYQGAKGLYSLKVLSEEAHKRLQSDLSCSLHFHIGNLSTSRAFIVSLWRLGEKIQDELFTLFPYYKTNPEGIKTKNYNNKLKSLFKPYGKSQLFSTYKDFEDNAYKMIFRFLSEGQMPSYKCNRKQAEHPIKTKWERPSRYLWQNLQNIIFSKRHTAENRLHHGTLNPQKIINWFFITVAICRYAESHMNDILIKDKNISLTDVLNYYRDAFPQSALARNLSDYLIGYVESRKSEMKLDYSNKDFAGTREMADDKDYVFSYKGVTNLF